MLEFFQTLSWAAVFQIILIDILLGGDNAVVIALACRRLPPDLRRQGILWGTVGAILLRVVLIFFALQLLTLPFLKIVGALLLVWIGVKLLLPQDEAGHEEIRASDHLLGAIRTVIVADAVMSIDNVIAVAGAAKGHIGLVAFGIAISVPIIVWGSRLVMHLMDRLPWLVTAGAGLLGWIAGGMWLGDTALPAAIQALPDWTDPLFAAAGALLVVALGKGLARRAQGH